MKKISKTIIVNVMAISIGVIMMEAGVQTYERGVVKYNCIKEVSNENWEIKSHITTSGNVSDETIEKVCSIIKTKVKREAYNYLANSGGKIVIVEGDDIKEYILSHYSCEKAREVKTNIRGYAPYFKNEDNVLKKVDVVIASDCLDSLEHEFNHVLDYSHGYSDTKEFQRLYKNADGERIFPDEADREYYMGQTTEFFAECATMYMNNELTGKYPELEKYFSSIL